MPIQNRATAVEASVPRKVPAGNCYRNEASGFDEVVDEADDFKALSKEEANRLRRRLRPLSVTAMLAAQAVTGVLVAVGCWGLTGLASAGWSALYGALAVLLPAALLARGLARQAGVASAGAALAGFFVWEGIKIVVTVAMLLLAPRLVPQLSWLALLAGFVVTMKVYWLAVWLRPVHPASVGQSLDETVNKNG